MAALFNCAICCMLLSIWAVIQLSIMGVFYFLEATVLIEDTEAHVFADYADFIKKTKENYKMTAINCWITAVLYAIMIGISWACLKTARKKAKLEMERLEDDNIACTPVVKVEKKKKVKKPKKKSDDDSDEDDEEKIPENWAHWRDDDV